MPALLPSGGGGSLPAAVTCTFSCTLSAARAALRLPSAPTHAQASSAGAVWARGACAQLGVGTFGGGPAAVVGSGQSPGARRRSRCAVRVLLVRHRALPARIPRSPPDQSRVARRADQALRRARHAWRRALLPEGGDAAAPPAPAPALVRRRARQRRAYLRAAHGDRAGFGDGGERGAEAPPRLLAGAGAPGAWDRDRGSDLVTGAAPAQRRAAGAHRRGGGVRQAGGGRGSAAAQLGGDAGGGPPGSLALARGPRPAGGGAPPPPRRAQAGRDT